MPAGAGAGAQRPLLHFIIFPKHFSLLPEIQAVTAHMARPLLFPDRCKQSCQEDQT